MNPPPPFLGTHLRRLADRRLSLPASWLAGPPPDREFVLLAYPGTLATSEVGSGFQHPRLVVCPAGVWHRRVVATSGSPTRPDPNRAAFLRVLAGAAARVGLDSRGRFRIPERLLRTLGPVSEVVLVGQLDRFEIWAPDRWAAEHLQADDSPGAPVDL